MHWRNGLPRVPPDVEPLSTGHTHRSVVSADAVKEAVECAHSATRTAAAHGWCRLPPAHSRVEPLHARLVVG